MNNLSHNIEQYIHTYLPIDDPLYSYDYYKHKEFYDLKLDSFEVPDPDSLGLKHQLLQRRYFSPFTNQTRGLIYHEMGTGKSRIISLIVEFNKRYRKCRNYKCDRALIILPNKKLVNQLRDEIYNIFKDEYEYDYSEKEKIAMRNLGISISLSEKAKEFRIRKNINKIYQIVTTSSFFKNMGTDKYIIDNFSNRLIIIDEAHHYRIQTSSKDKSPGIDSQTYDKVYHFLHTVKNCTILLFTGTPIWDKFYDFPTIINLILSRDDRLPEKDSFKRLYYTGNKINPEMRERLMAKLQGLISFLRSNFQDIRKVDVGLKFSQNNTNSWLKYTTVFPCILSKYQQEIVNYVNEKNENSKGLENNTFNSLLCVIPNINEKGEINGGYYDDKDRNLMRIVQHHQNKYVITNKYVRDEFLNNLYKYSSCFSAVLQIIKDNPKKKIFIFNNNIKSQGGLILLSIILELHGYKWNRNIYDLSDEFKNDKKSFITVSGTGKLPIITKDKQIIDILNVYNDSSNRYGDKCQVLLGSSVIAEGINLKDVRIIINMTPWWNKSKDDQIEGRIYRQNSLNNLEKDERTIEIYRLCPVYKCENTDCYIGKGYGEEGMKEYKFSKEENVIIRRYKRSENKDYENSQLYRLMKEVAWDCPLTYKRNIGSHDVDNSRECNYTKCNYTCYNFPENMIDKSKKVWEYKKPEHIINNTYNIYYSGKEKSTIKDKIIRLYKSSSNYNFEVIKSKLGIDNEMLLLECLSELINDTVVIYDMFGFMTYLKEDNDYYFLIPVMNMKYNVLDKIYNDKVYLSKIGIDTDIIENNLLKQSLDIIYGNYDDSVICDENFKLTDKNIHKLYFNTIITMFENIVYYEHHQEEIGNYEIFAHEKQIIMSYLKKELILLEDISTEDNPVYIHFLHYRDYYKPGFGKYPDSIEQQGKTQIYNDGWRSMTKEQEEKYWYLISNVTKVASIDFDKIDYDFHGIIDSSGKFKIRIKNEKGKKKTTGRECVAAGWSKEYIYELFYFMKKYPPHSEYYETYDREELIHYIKLNQDFNIFINNIDKFNDNDLRNILSLQGYSKIELCDFIQKWMEDNDLIAYVE